MKKSGKHGDKVPSTGETTYSGGAEAVCNNTVTAVSCSYSALAGWKKFLPDDEHGVG